MLQQLASMPIDVVERVICLVRATDDTAASERIMSVLRKRGLSVERERYQAHAADLAQPDLALNDRVDVVTDKVDIIVHVSTSNREEAHL